MDIVKISAENLGSKVANEEFCIRYFFVLQNYKNRSRDIATFVSR